MWYNNVPVKDVAEEVSENVGQGIRVQGLRSRLSGVQRREEGATMSQLRKREDGPEEGAASTVMGVIQNNIRLRLKVERRMAAPFIIGNELLRSKLRGIDGIGTIIMPPLTFPGQAGNKRNHDRFRKI
jgi:hypothetical protein